MIAYARSILSMAVVAGVAHAEEPAILDIQPSVRDSLLVCHVVTNGLPDPPSASTLSSGLPSALSIAFTLLDASGQPTRESVVEIRIEPDLWERRFLLETPLWDTPFATLKDVTAALARLGPLPVARLASLAPDVPHRVRARLAVHPIARAEVERVQSMFTESGSTDRREVSVGLGSLVRFFLGRHSDERWISDVTSPPFTRASLESEEND